MMLFILVFFFSFDTYGLGNEKRDTERERGNSDIPGISKFGCERTDTINTCIHSLWCGRDM